MAPSFGAVQPLSIDRRRWGGQSGAPVHSQAVRNPDNGKLQEMRYELAVDFVLGVHVTPEHDRGCAG